MPLTERKLARPQNRTSTSRARWEVDHVDGMEGSPSCRPCFQSQEESGAPRCKWRALTSSLGSEPAPVCHEIVALGRWKQTWTPSNFAAMRAFFFSYSFCLFFAGCSILYQTVSARTVATSWVDCAKMVTCRKMRKCCKH